MKMKKAIRIGIIGQSERPTEPLSKETTEVAYKMGYIIGKNGWQLISGGRDGVMRESSRGAKDAGGLTIGIMPSMDKNEANDYVDVVITTGLGIGMRSELMIHTVDIVVMIGGKNGTLKELSAAYLNKKPIIVIKNTGGIIDKLKDFLFEGKYIDDRKNIEILFADSPEDAEKLIKKIIE
jgi:uncharacterized protein (TIGR00725 family)